MFCVWNLPGYKLEVKTTRISVNRSFGEQKYLHIDHRQGVYLRPLCRFYLLSPYHLIGVEKFGGAVTDSAATVGG